jgi:hypothetical protein
MDGGYNYAAVFEKGAMAMVKIKKKDFNAGSPYSSWLKEEIIGEIADHKNGHKGRGLIKKYNVRIFDGIENVILNRVGCLDDYTPELRKMAIEIIQTELDPTFKG